MRRLWLISVLTIICMLGAGMVQGATTAQADSVSYPSGDCVYTFDQENGILTIAPADGAENGTLENWEDGMPPWQEWKTFITSVKIEPGVSAVTCHNMFEGCNSLTALDLSGLDTSGVTDMSSMFKDCNSLTALDLSGLDTSGVTNMNSMFEGCSSLTALDLSGFDTSDVTDMGYMFSNCGNLTEVDVSEFDTSNVTDMSYMFGGCRSLTELNLASFTIKDGTYISGMLFVGEFSDNEETDPALKKITLGANFKCINGGETIELFNLEEGYAWHVTGTDIFMITDELYALHDKAGETCTYEIAELASYSITEGSGSSFTEDTSGNLTFTANGDFAKFTGVKVDESLIDPSNYTAVSGSTVITLKNEYLQTLSPGTHTISVVYTDGEATADFSVEAQEETPTDVTSIVIYVVIGVIVVLALVGIIVFRKKKKA